MKLQINPYLQNFHKGLCPSSKNHITFKSFYKFCNILIPGQAGPTKQFADLAGLETSARLTSLISASLVYSPWGPLPGGGQVAAAPRILEESFSIYSAPPPDFGGFCSEILNSIIKFLELRE